MRLRFAIAAGVLLMIFVTWLFPVNRWPASRPSIVKGRREFISGDAGDYLVAGANLSTSRCGHIEREQKCGK